MSEADVNESLATAQTLAMEASRLEAQGDLDEADRYWRLAEDHYEAAGVDAEWFDHGALAETLDEPPRPLWVRDIQPSPAIEMTDEPESREIKGIVALESIVVDVEQ